MPTFLRRLRARLKYWNHAAQLKRELDVHRAMIEDDARDAGHAAPADARWQAARRIGNDTIAREDARAVWIARWLEQLLQDVRYAVRGLRRSPGFALSAGLTLVAAIGLNASLFSAINAVLLRPWPVADSGRVVSAFAARGTTSVVFGGWPAAEYRYLRARARTVDLVAMADERVTFDDKGAGAGDPVRIASDNYFSTLGVPIALGRGFEAADDVVDAPRAVTVLSDRTWRDVYGARPSIIGEAVPLNGVPFMVIGVAGPRAGDNPLDPPSAAWLPFASLQLLRTERAQRERLVSPSACCDDIAGRLRDGATAAAAEAELTGLSRQFRAANGTRFAGVRVTGTALMDTPRAGTATPVFGLLLAGVLLLMALACANVGNLVLARAIARDNEVRVRLSLGGGRARIVRQFLTESLVLSALAAAAALPLAYWLPQRVLAAVSPLAAWGFDTRPDATVFAFTALLVAAATLLFGLAPALRVTRHGTLAPASARATVDRGTARLRLTLLAAQIAIGAVLIVVSVLLGRGVARLSVAPIGFDSSGLAAGTVWLPRGAYDTARADALGRAVLAAMPSAKSARAAVVAFAPMQSGRPSATVRQASDAPRDARRVDWETVSPEFFDVMGIPIVDGGPAAGGVAPDEVVVDQRLADALGGSPLGREIVTADGRAFRIAGVARNARLGAVDSDEPTVYRVGVSDRAGAAPVGKLTFVVRGPDAVRALQQTVARAEPRATVDVRAVDDYMRDQVRPSQIGAAIAGALGVLAATVSAVGVFGVFAFLVMSREREVGVRLALGATAGDAAMAVLKSASLALGSGLGVGLLAAVVLVPALRQYLFGLTPFDPVAFGLAAAVVSGSAAVAVIGPIRYVLRLDPARILRGDS